MVEELVKKGALLEDLAATLPRYALRRINGDPHTRAEVEAAVLESSPGHRVDRFFLDNPLRQGDQTWVLSLAWGAKTEPTFW
jgi:hypothetical protein